MITISKKIATKDAALIYRSTWEAIQKLPDEQKQFEVVRLLTDFQIYGTEPCAEDPFISAIVTMAIPPIISARQRYEVACKNGAKGGRPETFTLEDILRLHEQGYTQKQIATELGCDPSTVQRKLTNSTLPCKTEQNLNIKKNINNKKEDSSDLSRYSFRSDGIPEDDICF